MRKLNILVVVLAMVMFPILSFSQVIYKGVNLAGAEFGAGTLPGTYGLDYTYPTPGEVDYFTGKGMMPMQLYQLFEEPVQQI